MYGVYNMTNYIVRLTLKINGYEKIMPHLIQADNEAEAIEQALRNESHNDIDRDYDEFNEWDDDGMIYHPLEVTEITDLEAKVLRKLGI